jgi:hypothetical protein
VGTALSVNAHHVEGSRHAGNPRRTQDEATHHVGHVVHAESDPGEPDRQDCEHGKRDGGSPPCSLEKGQEDDQKHGVPDYRRLGVGAGEAQTLRTSDRVAQSGT